MNSNLKLKTNKMKAIKLGSKAKCKVTGFTGTVTARVEYLNGCIQYSVVPKMTEEGKMPACEYIDEAQLEVIKDEVDIQPKKIGGPQRDCPKY